LYIDCSGMDGVGSGIGLWGVCCCFVFPWRGGDGVYILWDGMVIGGTGGTGVCRPGRRVVSVLHFGLGWSGLVWSRAAFFEDFMSVIFEAVGGCHWRTGTRKRGLGFLGNQPPDLPVLLPPRAFAPCARSDHSRGFWEAADIRLQFLLGLWDGASVEHSLLQRRRAAHRASSLRRLPRSSNSSYELKSRF
jgi:hypothetical protein